MFKKSLLISSLLVALSTPLWAADIDTTVIATVNGKDVIAQELIMTAQQNKFDYKALNNEQKLLLLNGLINRILVAETAKEQKMDEDPEIQLTLKAINDSVLAASLLEKKTAEVKLTDAEIKTYYDEKIITNVQKEYKARHILLSEKTTSKTIALPEELSPVKAEADKLYAQLKGGDAESFAKVAKEKSADKGSAVNGGDLGWFNPATMVPSFAKAVKEAEKGKVTKPIKSQFGWHIIYVEDMKDITPPTLDESKAKITQILTKQKISEYLASLEKAATIDIKLGK